MIKIVATMFLLSLFAGDVSARASRTIAFCVSPGDSVQAMRANCDRLQAFTEYTEEGEATSYVASHGPYVGTVEVHGDTVERIRFTKNPVPHVVRIGQSFAEVRKRFGSLELIAEAGEAGAVALADAQAGIYIAFDTSGIATDWYFRQALDEEHLSDARVVSIHWTRTAKP